ncbi:MAG: 2-C-methyl-D-erythritol 4-phosphate cytidylyltransferase, partial [Limnohabitans sp.]
MSLFHALVPCAGSGTRAGSELPKQYRLLAGRPMVMHTLQALSLVPQLASGWVVVSPDD